jgi:hypothetical protein
MQVTTLIVGLLAAGADAIATPRLSGRQTSETTAQVKLKSLRGSATALASGFIYGWPDNGTDADTSIPSHFPKDIAFRANRAGGAQLSAPALGWAAGGYESYIGRFESTLSNYRTTRKYGGVFILLPHDLWGADGLQGGESKFPGDDGDWTEMETFWTQVINDLKAADALEDLVIDIWNEPDVDSFWDRSFEQYLEYYVRAHRMLRRVVPHFQ